MLKRFLHTYEIRKIIRYTRYGAKMLRERIKKIVEFWREYRDVLVALIFYVCGIVFIFNYFVL